MHNHADKKRGFPRIELKREASFQLLRNCPQGENLDLKATLKNISVSGIYMETEEKSFLPRIGDIVWVKFRLSQQEVKLMGEIRRIIHHDNNILGIGLMFINIPSSIKKEIWDLVNKKESS